MWGHVSLSDWQLKLGRNWLCNSTSTNLQQNVKVLQLSCPILCFRSVNFDPLNTIQPLQWSSALMGELRLLSSHNCTLWSALWHQWALSTIMWTSTSFRNATFDWSGFHLTEIISKSRKKTFAVCSLRWWSWLLSVRLQTPCHSNRDLAW